MQSWVPPMDLEDQEDRIRVSFEIPGVNRAEITKYRAFYPESVYLSTVIKNLETAEPLSAYSKSSV